jgi:acetyltransferase-like isoleucine patch superfamily enzyme
VTVTAQVSPLSVVADNVELGAGSVVEELCVVGRYSGSDMTTGRTVIGAGAKVRSHTVIYAGNTIGARFQTGHHVLLRESNNIGDDVSIGSMTVIEHHVTIGAGVRIHSQCFVPEYSVLEEGAWIGPRVTLTNAPFPRCPDVSRCISGVRVGRDARVGANVTILPGVRIGERAVIGAGAVVSRDVPAEAVVVGTPARVAKNIYDLRCPVGLDHLPYPETRNGAQACLGSHS